MDHKKIHEILESCPSAVRLQGIIDKHLEGFSEEEQKAMVTEALSVEVRGKSREKLEDQPQKLPYRRRA